MAARFRLTPVEGGRRVATGKIDDRELVADARRGDEDAFAELVRRHSGGMHRAVSRILHDREEAWDVVQMAFLKAWQRLDRYDERWRFATWAYRIASNLAIDLLRSRTSRDNAHQQSHLRAVGPDVAEPEAYHRIAGSEIGVILDEAVEHLSPQQRAAFVLREIEGHDTAEVAEMLDCTATTVRNHVFQARKTLQRLIRERYPELAPSR